MQPKRLKPSESAPPTAPACSFPSLQCSNYTTLSAAWFLVLLVKAASERYGWVLPSRAAGGLQPCFVGDAVCGCAVLREGAPGWEDDVWQ